MEIGTFACSICGESSRDICVFCTKDACRNHLCERCRRCSDCCECEMRVENFTRETQASNGQLPVSAYLERDPRFN